VWRTRDVDVINVEIQNNEKYNIVHMKEDSSLIYSSLIPGPIVHWESFLLGGFDGPPRLHREMSHTEIGITNTFAEWLY
jgi:hypothetical protein